jgi:hypothetical protein
MPSEQPRWQKQQSPKQCECGSDRNANEPQRQRHEPNKGKKNQRKQSDGPAEHEQNTPANEKNENLHISILFNSDHATTS